MLLHDTDGGGGKIRKRKGPHRGPFRPTACREAALQNPVQATPPLALMPMPRAAVLATLDSRSVQLTPNPSFWVTLLLGVMPRTAEPRWSWMPSPAMTVPGTAPGMALLFWIVLFPICAVDLTARTPPKLTLLLITASRMESADPRKPEMPPVKVGLPLPVMVLTVDMSKLASPRFTEPLRRLMPGPVFPEIVLPPMTLAVALAMLTPLPLNAAEGLVPLPVTWFAATSAVEPYTIWMPFTPLALIVLPPATLKLSMPIRAVPPLNTPTPIRAFWLTCELITLPLAASTATPSRALLRTLQPSTTPLAP